MATKDRNEPRFVWSNIQQQPLSFYESCVFDVERTVNVLSLEQEDRICRAPVSHRDLEDDKALLRAVVRKE